MPVRAKIAAHSHYVSSVGEWTRDRVKWLAGLIVVTAVAISLVVAADDMEFRAVGGFFAILGLVGTGIILFRWRT